MEDVAVVDGPLALWQRLTNAQIGTASSVGEALMVERCPLGGDQNPDHDIGLRLDRSDTTSLMSQVKMASPRFCVHSRCELCGASPVFLTIGIVR